MAAAVTSTLGLPMWQDLIVEYMSGFAFVVVARNGQTLPDSARYTADTVNLGPGQRYDVIWTATNPGKWMIHCHIGHHTTNNNMEMDGGGDLWWSLMQHLEIFYGVAADF